MTLTELYECLPFLAVAAGVLLLAWGQRNKIASFVSGLWPSAEKKGKGMTPAKRFETFYALRAWCKEAGYDSAVTALDDEVLPAIVRTEGPVPSPFLSGADQ